ncbi:MAG: type II secretion system ATPase GspE [Desulforegulaceae bacterium]|nr:type II secretion system ATPase GspE [Desulforegulaceae bacterium]
MSEAKILSEKEILINEIALNSGLDIEKINEIFPDNSLAGGITEVLAKNGDISEEILLKVFSSITKLKYLKTIQEDNYDFSFTKNISINFLKKFFIAPLVYKDENKKSILLLNDISFFNQADDVAFYLGLKKYSLVFCPKNEIISFINSAYDQSDSGSADDIVQDVEESAEDILSEIEETTDLLDDTASAPIIRLVNHIISRAVKVNASDIHIEPYQDKFHIRFRVDGVLYEMLSPPRWMQTALISRIKVMAKLNIAEKRLPQDGRIEVKIGNQQIDIRVSTIPTGFGERVVMRLLNKSGGLLRLGELGMSKNIYDIINSLIRLPNGIILVTGPTGSGKTTTLYAVLSEINRPDINIITIEDPVEYQIKGIGQIQVNRKIGLTFAKGLRSIVRQDPDVILIGEIRDQETAEIAVQSALTGHLVFSTLHTNDSASAITRLSDIGIEKYLISSSVKAVIAQRLVRVLCNNCKKEYIPEDIEAETLGISGNRLKGKTIYTSVGCEECVNTGYKGRMSIYEIMIMDNEIQSLILKTQDSNLIQKEALKKGMTTLRQDGVEKILNGITTIEEVIRVTNG